MYNCPCRSRRPPPRRAPRGRTAGPRRPGRVYTYVCIYIYIYTHIYVYTYLCMYLFVYLFLCILGKETLVTDEYISYVSLVYYIIHAQYIVVYHIVARYGCPPWLRTNGVSTNGATAKVISFGRLGKKVRPGTFGKIEVG